MNFTRYVHLPKAAVLALTCLLLPAGNALNAQQLMRYGDYRSGSITGAGQVQRYFLQGGRAGDILRVSFTSQRTGYPCNCFHHRLDVFNGTTLVGTVSGSGVLTKKLNAAVTYTIAIRATDNQRTGWYAFQVDRLNDPVNAQRVGLDWTLRGSVTRSAAFDVYTGPRRARSTVSLRHTSQRTGFPCNCYHHYAELLDSSGNRVTWVRGNGSSSIKLTKSDTYSILVAADGLNRTGWYATSLDCQSWPATPCDTQPHTSNFGDGWPGTRGVPRLTARGLPRLGSTLSVEVGNSYGQATPAWFLIGTSLDRVATGFGGTLNVQAPVLVPIPSLPPAGGTVSVPIPNDPFLTGLAFAMQAIVTDPGASRQLAFSRGLLMITAR